MLLLCKASNPGSNKLLVGLTGGQTTPTFGVNASGFLLSPRSIPSPATIGDGDEGTGRDKINNNRTVLIDTSPQ